MNWRWVLHRKVFWVGAAAALLIGLPALDDGCGTHEPWHKRRPSTVPKQAVYVPVVKDYWYVYCWVDHNENVDHCRIYYSDGGILREDAYLPYDGSAVVPAERLQISSRTGSNGPYIIYLEDGTILLTRSDFENQQRFIDWKFGKRKSP